MVEGAGTLVRAYASGLSDEAAEYGASFQFPFSVFGAPIGAARHQPWAKIGRHFVAAGHYSRAFRRVPINASEALG